MLSEYNMEVVSLVKLTYLNILYPFFSTMKYSNIFTIRNAYLLLINSKLKMCCLGSLSTQFLINYYFYKKVK